MFKKLSLFSLIFISTLSASSADQSSLPRRTYNHNVSWQLSGNYIDFSILYDISGRHYNLFSRTVVPQSFFDSCVTPIEISTLEVDSTCSMCFGSLTGAENCFPCKINCNSKVSHLFCKECIIGYIESSHDLKCPICRTFVIPTFALKGLILNPNPDEVSSSVLAFKVLLECGFDPNIKIRTHCKPLSCLQLLASSRYMDSQHLPLIHLLIAYRADINIINDEGMSLLDLTLLSSNLPVASLLISKGLRFTADVLSKSSIKDSLFDNFKNARGVPDNHSYFRSYKTLATDFLAVLSLALENGLSVDSLDLFIKNFIIPEDYEVGAKSRLHLLKKEMVDLLRGKRPTYETSPESRQWLLDLSRTIKASTNNIGLPIKTNTK